MWGLLETNEKQKEKKEIKKTDNYSFFLCVRMNTAKHSMMKHIPILCPPQFPSAKCLTNKEGKKKREGWQRGNSTPSTARRHRWHFFFLFCKEAINRAITGGRAQRSHAGWRLKGAAMNLSARLLGRGRRNFKSRIGTFRSLTTPIYKRAASGSGAGIQRGN